MTNEIEPFIPLRRAAQLLGLPISTLRREAQQKRIRHRWIGGKMYFTGRVLREYQQCSDVDRFTANIVTRSSAEAPKRGSATARDDVSVEAALRTVSSLKARARTRSMPALARQKRRPDQPS